MRDVLNRSFAIASAIVFAMVGLGAAVNHALSTNVETSLHAVNRLAELRVAANRALVHTLDLEYAGDAADRREAAAALGALGDYFAEAHETALIPSGSFTRALYDLRATPARREAEYSLRARLDLLAERADDLSRAGDGRLPESAVLGVRSLTRSGLNLDLDTIVAWHRSVLFMTIWIVDVVQLFAIPSIAVTLFLIWRLLIVPARARELAAQRRLRQREAEAVELAEKASAASKAKSEFLAVMSHELRTPMNGIIGLAEVLEATVEDATDRETVGALRNSAEAMMVIVNDLLEVSRAEARGVQLEAVEFSPAKIATRIRSIHRPSAEAKNLSFSVDYDPFEEAPRIGDPHRVMQILHNVISNAIKFTDSGGVVVSIESAPGQPLKIEVGDTGIGMTADQVDKVFDYFAQADSSSVRRFGGTGLGMAIVRRLVDAMNGTIEIQSAPGRGTTVHVALPLREAARAETGESQVATGAVLPSDLRVLVADDIATNRTVIEMMLRAMGVSAVLVVDGKSAVAACREESFDLLLLDIAMPGLDGVQALQAIRAAEARESRALTPAIAVTANALSHQVSGYLEAGFDDCVAKPIDREELRSAIARQIARAGSRRPAA